MTFKAWGRRKRAEWRRDVTMVWNMARLIRAKEIPSLNKLLGEEPKQLTEDEMAERRRQFEAAKARMGATVWRQKANSGRR